MKQRLLIIPMLLATAGCANLQEQIDVINSQITNIESAQRASDASSNDLRRLAQSARTAAVQALDEAGRNMILNDAANERIDELADHSHPTPNVEAEHSHSEPDLERARDDEGRFVADNPETADVNEAFVEEEELF